jgi:hypothetical protein
MTDYKADSRMVDKHDRATGDRYGVGHAHTANRSKVARPDSHRSAPKKNSGSASQANRPTSGIKQSAKSVLLGLLNRLPFKPNSPISTALVRHYVEASGDPVSLKELPFPWQDLILKATHGRAGYYRDVSSYDVGLYDMQNALGHFDVGVKAMGGGEMLYSIHDEYQFGFRKGDKQARHGFPLGEMSDVTLSALGKMLPSDEYWNPGGFAEHWEISRIRGENILFIPQQFLAQQGVPFEVYASFRR